MKKGAALVPPPSLKHVWASTSEPDGDTAGVVDVRQVGDTELQARETGCEVGQLLAVIVAPNGDRKISPPFNAGSAMCWVCEPELMARPTFGAVIVIR